MSHDFTAGSSELFVEVACSFKVVRRLVSGFQMIAGSGNFFRLLLAFGESEKESKIVKRKKV